MRNRTIEVLDSIMGSGKTTGIIKWMNKNPNRKYLYVSPLLTEVEDRIPDECASLGVISPNINEHRTKGEHLLELLKDGCNVSFTHKLFTDLTSEHLKVIESQRYTLIVDEEIDFIEACDRNTYNDEDISTLIKSGHLLVDNDNLGKVEWVWGTDTFVNRSAYTQLKNMCETGSLYSAKRDKSMLVKMVSPLLIESLDRCILTTYKFNGSVTEQYCKLHNFEVKGFEEVLLEDNESVIKEKMKTLININMSNSVRKVGNLNMSTVWYDKASDCELKRIENAIRSCCRKSPKETVRYTLPKDTVIPHNDKPKIKVKGYTAENCFTSSNSSSNNIDTNIDNLVYAYNKYIQNIVLSYLQDYELGIKHNDYALCSLLSWIWKSGVSDGKEITLSILPKRMRVLFRNWLDSE